MIPVSNYVVLVFCNWLEQKEGSNYFTLLSYMSHSDPENIERIEKYASAYLEEKGNKQVDSYEFAYKLMDKYECETRKLMQDRDELAIRNLIPISNVVLLDFCEWLPDRLVDPKSVIKMPSNVFEKYADEFIKDTGKGKEDKKQLLESFKINRLAKLLEIVGFDTSGFSKQSIEVFIRYNSDPPKYKCIILPLAEKENQTQYQKLINYYWKDLNYLSSNFLDIYYSESDIDKSGYDIAQSIFYLPERLKAKAPCLILWIDRLSEATSVPLDELDAGQMAIVIKTIVNCIKERKNLSEITEEATMKAKDERLINHGGNMNNFNVENKVKVGGKKNKVKVKGIILSPSKDGVDNEELMNDFNRALEEISKSQELDVKYKEIFSEIINTASTGVAENSIEKQTKAKTTWEDVKSKIYEVAPTLISVLGNMANIAIFFGLNQ